MSTKILNLRNVSEDEKMEIFTLLEEHEIEYYETTAGNFGISLAALWLKNENQLKQARDLLDEYAEQRLYKVREEYQQLKEQGNVRTLIDIVKENPLQYVIYLGIIIGLVYLSIAPYML
jgi:hypothetical protein